MVINKFEDKIFAGIRNWEILGKNFEKTFFCSIFGSSFQLKEVAERLQLNIQKIRVIYNRYNGSEINPFRNFIFSQNFYSLKFTTQLIYSPSGEKKNTGILNSSTNRKRPDYIARSNP